MKSLLMAMVLSTITTTSFANEFDHNVGRALADALRTSTVNCEVVYNHTGLNIASNNKNNFILVATQSEQFLQEINLEDAPSVVKYKKVAPLINLATNSPTHQFWEASYILSPDEATINEIVVELIDRQEKEVNIGTITKPEYVTKKIVTSEYKEVCTVKEVNSTNY